MHPDERTLAAAIKRTLGVAHGAKSRADTANGWSYHVGGLDGRLRALLETPEAEPERLLIQLHEEGEATLEEVLTRADADGGDGQAPLTAPLGCSTVLVLGDQLGYTVEEEALLARLGGCRASCSVQGLLTSHCIVLAHHALDQAEARRAIRGAR
jgi:tRNA pseudouridine-54 N-methylase